MKNHMAISKNHMAISPIWTEPELTFLRLLGCLPRV